MNEQHTLELSNFLRQQYLCESLTVKEVQTLLDYMELVELAPGDVIADVGEVGEALYFVVKGQAVLMSSSPEAVEIGRVSAGEMMGEMSFFDRQPRSVQMVAKGQETQVLKLPRTMYQRLRVEHPYIAVNLLEHAIISLDHLFREVTTDVTTLNQYFYGVGAGRR